MGQKPQARGRSIDDKAPRLLRRRRRAALRQQMQRPPLHPARLPGQRRRHAAALGVHARPRSQGRGHPGRREEERRRRARAGVRQRPHRRDGIHDPEPQRRRAHRGRPADRSRGGRHGGHGRAHQARHGDQREPRKDPQRRSRRALLPCQRRGHAQLRRHLPGVRGGLDDLRQEELAFQARSSRERLRGLLLGGQGRRLRRSWLRHHRGRGVGPGRLHGARFHGVSRPRDRRQRQLARERR